MTYLLTYLLPVVAILPYLMLITSQLWTMGVRTTTWICTNQNMATVSTPN